MSSRDDASRHAEKWFELSLHRQPGGTFGCRMTEENAVDVVHEDSPAANAGLRAGDLVLAVNGAPTRQPKAARRAVKAATDRGAFVLSMKVHRPIDAPPVEDAPAADVQRPASPSGSDASVTQGKGPSRKICVDSSDDDAPAEVDDEAAAADGEAAAAAGGGASGTCVEVGAETVGLPEGWAVYQHVTPSGRACVQREPSPHFPGRARAAC